MTVSKSHAAKPTSKRSLVEELDRLPPLRKIHELSKPEVLTGRRLPSLPIDLVLTRSNVRLDAPGNITSTPLVMGRPCFGQPVFHARFYDRIKVRDKNGVMRKTRCSACQVELRCSEVALQRIHVVPDLNRTYKEFLKEGGAQGLREPSQAPGAQTAYERFVRACVRHGGFANSNDAAVTAEYDRRAAQRGAKRAQYMCNKRSKGIRAGVIDKALDIKLIQHRDLRRKALVWLVSNKGSLAKPLPPKLNRLHVDSCDRVADVWLARTVLEIMGKPAGKRAIATEINRRSPGKYSSLELLRKYAGSDLARIDILEMLPIGHGLRTIWPTFDLGQAIATTHVGAPGNETGDDQADVTTSAPRGNGMSPALVSTMIDDDEEGEKQLAGSPTEDDDAVLTPVAASHAGILVTVEDPKIDEALAPLDDMPAANDDEFPEIEIEFLGMRY